MRFAALVHDLGKGVTPPEQWPRHVGHEQAGVRVIAQLSERIKVPNEHRDLGQLVSREHQRIHRAREMRDATILEVLEACDAFRRPDRFERLLLACEADARGRGPELRQRPYPQADIMRSCLQAAAAVKLPPEVLQQHAGRSSRNAARRAHRRDRRRTPQVKCHTISAATAGDRS